MRTFWLYTLARLGIIIAVGLILFPFLGFNMVMALAAIIIGALLSYLFLGRMRAQVATDIEERVAKQAAKREAKPKRKGVDEEVEDQIVADRADGEENIDEDGNQPK